MTVRDHVPGASRPTLVERFCPDDSGALFASPGETIGSRGIDAVLAVPQAQVAAAAAAVLQDARGAGYPDPLLLGALPFAPDRPSHLLLPREVERVDGMPRPVAPGPPAVAGAVHWSDVPAGEVYTAGARVALERLEHEGDVLRKLVLARAIDATVEGPVDLVALVRRLAHRDRRATTFAVPLPEGATFVGATPELLVRRRGDRISSTPLAGSRPRSADPAEDARLAAELLRSAKDRHEHAIVVEAIQQALRPVCVTLDVPDEPVLVSTAAMWHLATPITGTVADPAVSSLALAALLHPTPAVCGTPADAARRTIDELEPFDRGFYTGAVGWCDAAGDGSWVVAIRCAEVQGSRVRAYAGAGLVPGSDPAAELAETGFKARTLLAALGAEA